MEALYSANPFARTKKVRITQQDRRSRSLSLAFRGRQERAQVVQQPNRQMKEVTSYFGNMQDVLGKDWHSWFLPFEARDRGCNGFDWTIRPIH